MRTDLTVFAKDFPESRLVVEVKAGVCTPSGDDPSVKQLALYMWGANCHHGLLVTPTKTYVLRDDFSAAGPEAIRVIHEIPTRTLFSRLVPSYPETISEQELEKLTRQWLERLTSSYDAALPDNADVMRAFFPEIVGAVAEGRVVSEAESG
jgi:hypothetical protein